jgi:hypothetical protein
MCLAREETDRVPFNYHFFNSVFDKKIRKALDIDFRRVNPPYIGKSQHRDLPDRKVTKDFGIRLKYIENQSGSFWEPCDFPLANATLQEAENWFMAPPDDYDYDAIPKFCAQYEDYYLIAGTRGIGDCINNTGFLCGMENVLIGLATEDPVVFTVMDRRRKIELEIMQRTFEAAKGRINMLLLGEDLGGQNSPLISKKMYEKHIKPRHKEFVELAKSFNAKVMMHSDGAISHFYDDFIEIGIDVHDAVQIETNGMDPERIQKYWGDKICFHGAVPVTGPLCFGTVEEIKKQTKKIINTLGQNGGYILSPSHDVQDNTPVENLLTMYETGREISAI